MKSERGSTERVRNLMRMLRERGSSDRSGEWFTDEMLEDVAPDVKSCETPVIIRRARATEVMLKAMTNAAYSKKTHTYEIKPGELIVGTMPMGSLGLGKVFPNYLTELEKEVAFYSCRGVNSVLGHNVAGYDRLVTMGIDGILQICDRRLKSLRVDKAFPIGSSRGIERKISFYEAVQISCAAVVDYANDYATLAEKQAKKEKNASRAKELLKIADVCRRVPLYPATNFHEALQSVWFMHVALHSSSSHIAFGRLDQVLSPFLEKSLKSGEIDEAGALELLECFWIKGAERLTLSMEHIMKQDHNDFTTGMGHNPFLVDQEVSVNQFMQNIVIGGQTRDGRDATNRCTYLFLDACASLGLPTPVLNVRLHDKTPPELLAKVSDTVMKSGCGLPSVYNDESVVTAMVSTGKIPREEALDYVVDGCWETLLNAKCDFNYTIVNMLTMLELALNEGALITSDRAQLRGPKQSYRTQPVKRMKKFEDLQDALLIHLRYFLNKAGMDLYANYNLEGAVTPVPLFSALLGQCLENGVDKSWGGADYNIGGVVFAGMPNCANSLAAIRQWVFESKTYTLEQVVEALKANYKGWDQMRSDFKSTPTFGNGQTYVDSIMAWLSRSVTESLDRAHELADMVFLASPRNRHDRAKIAALRNMAGYAGYSMKERLGDKFDIIFTAGCGTFEQYAHYGRSCAASADGRLSGEPLAPNFSPVSGTATHGVGGVLGSLKGLGLERFGAGVMVDICIEQKQASQALVGEILRRFTDCGGSILSLTVVGQETIRKVYNLCEEVRNRQKPFQMLREYSDLAVRVGGWNGPFVTLTKVQQENYLKRMLTSI